MLLLPMICGRVWSIMLDRPSACQASRDVTTAGSTVVTLSLRHPTRTLPLLLNVGHNNNCL
jgi:hypothetical protein